MWVVVKAVDWGFVKVAQSAFRTVEKASEMVVKSAAGTADLTGVSTVDL